jgi:hemoglobin-like flavoprotein
VFAAAFYRHLFTLEPELPRICGGDERAQRWLLATLDELIATLDTWAVAARYAQALGAGLAQRGLQQRHYTSIGVALLAALRDLLGATFTLEDQIAWARTYAALAEVMSDATAG